eukprot:TRINITY_DN2638_c1_g1_i1.p1 TRINITY_DN2638_c1_g1~~TRINITY_DN2638_c1_g1_i1.p1  ORF type:complete len:1152 (-),score=433.31 TRINITY_DN2638_c1_g1_i1:36-3491(-)
MDESADLSRALASEQSFVYNPPTPTSQLMLNDVAALQEDTLFMATHNPFEPETELESAATQIQRVFRGHTARTEMKLKEQKAMQEYMETPLPDPLVLYQDRHVPTNVEPPMIHVLVKEYKGDHVNNMFEGFGEIYFVNGAHYVGGVHEGKMHGFGKYTWPRGVVYEGNFVQNKIEGHGVYTWPNGSKYSGDLQDGLRHGSGVYEFYLQEEGEEATLCVYDGDWVKGKREGEGTLSFVNVAKQQQEKENDANVVSSGVSATSSSAVEHYYNGQWKNNLKHGNGVMAYPSGNVYDGQWEQDCKSGKGTMNWFDRNERYVGEWSKEKPHGQGTYSWFGANQQSPSSSAQFLAYNHYEGEFRFGRRWGNGVFYYSTGAKYEGEWKNDLKDGQGVFYFDDGNLFTGTFVKDRMQGFDKERSGADKSLGLEFSFLQVKDNEDQEQDGEAEEVAKLFDQFFDEEERFTPRELKTIKRQVNDLVLRHMSDMKRIYKHYTMLTEALSITTKEELYGELNRLGFWLCMKAAGISNYQARGSNSQIELDRYLWADPIAPVQENEEENEQESTEQEEEDHQVEDQQEETEEAEEEGEQESNGIADQEPQSAQPAEPVELEEQEQKEQSSGPEVGTETGDSSVTVAMKKLAIQYVPKHKQSQLQKQHRQDHIHDPSELFLLRDFYNLLVRVAKWQWDQERTSVQYAMSMARSSSNLNASLPKSPNSPSTNVGGKDTKLISRFGLVRTLERLINDQLLPSAGMESEDDIVLIRAMVDAYTYSRESLDSLYNSYGATESDGRMTIRSFLIMLKDLDILYTPEPNVIQSKTSKGKRLVGLKKRNMDNEDEQDGGKRKKKTKKGTNNNSKNKQAGPKRVTVAQVAQRLLTSQRVMSFFGLFDPADLDAQDKANELAHEAKMKQLADQRVKRQAEREQRRKERQEAKEKALLEKEAEQERPVTSGSSRSHHSIAHDDEQQQQLQHSGSKRGNKGKVQLRANAKNRHSRKKSNSRHPSEPEAKQSESEQDNSATENTDDVVEVVAEGDVDQTDQLSSNETGPSEEKNTEGDSTEEQTVKKLVMNGSIESEITVFDMVQALCHCALFLHRQERRILAKVLKQRIATKNEGDQDQQEEQQEEEEEEEEEEPIELDTLFHDFLMLRVLSRDGE